MYAFSEDELIERFFAPIAGPGGLGLKDDAALLEVPDGHELVLTKDALVAGIHFFAGDAPDEIARKALRVNLSDLAAKGAAPLGFLLALALPRMVDAEWLQRFAQGLGSDAGRYGLPLLGGDTVSTPGPLMVSITALGCVPRGRMVRRSGVKAGDVLYVSGTIGDAALGLRLRLGGARDAGWIDGLHHLYIDQLLDRYLLPQPRNALAATLQAHASGAMDVSDGFVGDMRKMLAASGKGGRIELAQVPFSKAARTVISLDAEMQKTALTGGDDYEIICSVSLEKTPAFEAGAAAAGVAVTRIGHAASGQVAFFDGQGAPVVFEKGSYSHF